MTITRRTLQAASPPRPAALVDQDTWTITGLSVTLIVNSVELGGVEEHIRQLAAGLYARGALVVVICPELPVIDPLAAALADAGVAVERLTLTRDVGTRAFAARFCRLVTILRARRVRLVHVHLTGYRGGRWVALAAKLARVPALVCTAHLAPEQRGPVAVRAERRLMSMLVDRFIAVSEASRRRQVQHLSLPAQKVIAIPNAVELDRHAMVSENARHTIRAELGIPEDAPVIGSVARLSEQKGHRYLIDALPAILAGAPATHVVLVGDGPLRETLEARARALDVHERVHFTGRRTDVPCVLAAMDMFVLPSLYEGLPLSILEAMAAGLPVVATNVDGTPEAVSDGMTGILVPPRDSVAIAESVVSLLQSRDRALRMAGAGRQRAAGFSIDAFLDRTLAVYRRALPCTNSG